MPDQTAATLVPAGAAQRSVRPVHCLILMVSLTGASAASAQTERPTRASPVEEEFLITTPSLVLPGSLVIPAGEARSPVAVIVAGSGPTDRNGNGPLVQTGLYRQLAAQLAERGIASLRYDKRGLAPGSERIRLDSLVVDDYVQDVRAAVDALRRDARFSSVVIIGHSEGAMHALLAANQGAPVAGVIMLAGVGRPLTALVRDQLALQLDSATVVHVDSMFRRYLRGDPVTDIPAIVRPLFVPQNRRFLASMAAYEPPAEVRRARVPLLIVSGGMDIQVTDLDARALRQVRSGNDSLDIRDANHVFKRAESRDPIAQRPLYQDASLPIVPELVPGLSGWIRKVTRRPPDHPPS